MGRPYAKWRDVGRRIWAPAHCPVCGPRQRADPETLAGALQEVYVGWRVECRRNEWGFPRWYARCETCFMIVAAYAPSFFRAFPKSETGPIEVLLWRQ